MKKLDKTNYSSSRRQFLGTSLIATAGLAISTRTVFGTPALLKNLGKPNSLIKGVQIGVITYSYRDLPDQSAEATLKYIVDSGISAIELMGEPAESFAGIPKDPVNRHGYYALMRKVRNKEALTPDEKKDIDEMNAQMKDYDKQIAEWRASVPMEKFVQLKKMYNDAGVSIYAWKPSAFGKNNTDAEIDYGFRVAKVLGATHVTTEHPGDDQRTKKLGEFAARHKIYMAYHGHLQQTPTLWDTALAQSKYNAINMDLGHYVAAGNHDALEFIRNKHDRIKSIHLKDRENKTDGQENMPWGQGDTPLVPALHLMRDQKYAFPGTIELEYKIPEGSDAVKEVAKCLEYSRKTLES